LKEGETVVDLGSGAGFDCFLAAVKVGARGRVIGVDMTPGMIERARRNAAKGGAANVEVRLGEIEALPVEDGTADVVISNCVINLSEDKERVFREAFRVLKPGGRLMVSDLVLVGCLPEVIRASAAGYVGCLSGAIPKDEYLGAMRAAGFQGVAVVEESPFPLESMMNDATAQAITGDPGVGGEDVRAAAAAVSSVKVSGVKPLL
jgi:SAM-dependent methyltransferase